MKDKLFYTSLGIAIGTIICMFILCFYPITETTQACSNCGMNAWYFKITEGE